MHNPSTTELEDRLWRELSPSAFVFLGMDDASDEDVPMTLHCDGDRRGSVWVFTTKGSSINREGAATARFISKGQDFFARISGAVRSEHDRAVIDKLWSPRIAAWYKGGREDPALAVVRFDTSEAEIWLGDMTPLTLIKMMVGANVHDDVQGHHATVRAD
jgi:general stress protein 26